MDGLNNECKLLRECFIMKIPEEATQIHLTALYLPPLKFTAFSLNTKPFTALLIGFDTVFQQEI